MSYKYNHWKKKVRPDIPDSKKSGVRPDPMSGAPLVGNRLKHISDPCKIVYVEWRWESNFGLTVVNLD